MEYTFRSSAFERLKNVDGFEREKLQGKFKITGRVEKPVYTLTCII